MYKGNFGCKGNAISNYFILQFCKVNYNSIKLTKTESV